MHTVPTSNDQQAEEMQQLRANLAALTAQCAQLDEANRAWQHFHQTQLDSFRNKLQECLFLDANASLDQLAQVIVDEMTNERDSLGQQLQALKEQCDELDMINKQLTTDKQFLNSQLDHRPTPIGSERETQTIGKRSIS